MKLEQHDLLLAKAMDVLQGVSVALCIYGVGLKRINELIISVEYDVGFWQRTV